MACACYSEARTIAIAVQIAPLLCCDHIHLFTSRSFVVSSFPSITTTEFLCGRLRFLRGASHSPTQFFFAFQQKKLCYFHHAAHSPEAPTPNNRAQTEG